MLYNSNIVDFFNGDNYYMYMTNITINFIETSHYCTCMYISSVYELVPSLSSYYRGYWESMAESWYSNQWLVHLVS